MAARDRLLELLRTRSLRTGDFVLSSGKRSSYYIDCRLTTMHAEGLVLVGELGLAAIRGKGWTAAAIGGMTLGADPVAYAVAAHSFSHPPAIHGFTVRKAAKEHGTGRRIEGCFTPGSQVVIVEDVITTGGSALEALRAVRADGGTAVGVLALVDRGEGGREAIEAEGIQVHALFHIRELLA